MRPLTRFWIFFASFDILVGLIAFSGSVGANSSTKSVAKVTGSYYVPKSNQAPRAGTISRITYDGGTASMKWVVYPCHAPLPFTCQAGDVVPATPTSQTTTGVTVYWPSYVGRIWIDKIHYAKGDVPVSDAVLMSQVGYFLGQTPSDYCPIVNSCLAGISFPTRAMLTWYAAHPNVPIPNGTVLKMKSVPIVGP